MQFNVLSINNQENEREKFFPRIVEIYAVAVATASASVSVASTTITKARTKQIKAKWKIRRQTRI